MELLILRHGKSSWSDLSIDDYDRPLKKRGKQNASQMGNYLLQNELLPDRVWSSSARRALSTAQRALTSMDLPHSLIESSPAFYHADAKDWLQALTKLPSSCVRLLIVGHNPGLEELLILLCDHRPTRPSDGKLLPTASLAVLHLMTTWAKLTLAQAKLTVLIRPSHLESDPLTL